MLLSGTHVSLAARLAAVLLVVEFTTPVVDLLMAAKFISIDALPLCFAPTCHVQTCRQGKECVLCYFHALTLVCRPGEWMDVEIPLSRFLLTWRGKLVETKVEMNPRRIRSLGISLAGGSELQPDGPFSLGLRSISAVNSRLAGGAGGQEE